MLVGEIRQQVDSIWNDFWSGGLSNPLSVMEQITYLLFIKRLDELHTVEEKKAARFGKAERSIFPPGTDPRGLPYDDLRWSHFSKLEPREMFKVVDEHVFPFIREKVAGNGSIAQHMKDARVRLLIFSSAKMTWLCVSTTPSHSPVPSGWSYSPRRTSMPRSDIRRTRNRSTAKPMSEKTFLCSRCTAPARAAKHAGAQ